MIIPFKNELFLLSLSWESQVEIQSIKCFSLLIMRCPNIVAIHVSKCIPLLIWDMWSISVISCVVSPAFFFISISICLSSTAAYLREHPQSSRSKLPLPKHSIIICNYQHYCYHYNFTPNLCIYLGLGLAENVRVNFLFDKMDGALKIKTKMAALLGLAIFFLLLVYFFFVWLLHLSTLDQSVGPVQFLAPLNWN